EEDRDAAGPGGGTAAEPGRRGEGAVVQAAGASALRRSADPTPSGPPRAARPKALAVVGKVRPVPAKQSLPPPIRPSAHPFWPSFLQPAVADALKMLPPDTTPSHLRNCWLRSLQLALSTFRGYNKCLVDNPGAFLFPRASRELPAVTCAERGALLPWPAGRGRRGRGCRGPGPALHSRASAGGAPAAWSFGTARGA